MSIDIVVAGYVLNNGKVLLIYHNKLQKWLPVGGHIEKDETPDEALRREIKEELGIEINFLNYPKLKIGNNNEFALPFHVNLHPIKEGHSHYCLFYLCVPKSGNIKINKSEISDYKWFSKEELDGANISESIKAECLLALELAGK